MNSREKGNPDSESGLRQPDELVRSQARPRLNSRRKGARGERQWRDELRANGYMARRGQQFSGSPDSPDVVCEDLSWIHFEVKAVERLNIEDAMDQARRDAGGTMDCGPGTKDKQPQAEDRGRKVPVVVHRRNYRPWLVTMEAETFFRVLRGDFQEPTGAEHSPMANGSYGGSQI